jgi:hypothetical protein
MALRSLNLAGPWFVSNGSAAKAGIRHISCCVLPVTFELTRFASDSDDTSFTQWD